MISHIKALVLVLGGGRAALNSCSKSVLAVRLSTQTIPAAQTKEEADWFKQITADNGRRPVNFSTRLLWSKNSSYSDLSDEEKLAAINLMWQERIATFQSAPKLLTEKHIAALKRCQGYTHMKETFTYLAKKEYYEKKDEAVKLEVKRKKAENKERITSLLKGLPESSTTLVATNYPGASSFLRRINNNMIKLEGRLRILTAVRTGEPSVVFDFQFTRSHLKDKTILSMAKQYQEVIKQNRTGARSPFQIHFCNYDSTSEFHTRFGDLVGLDDNLIFETSQSYLDVFAKERLVYLSRDARTVMTDFDPEKVYIIGNIIDDGTNKFKYASLNRATQDGIECMRLPLNEHVGFVGGKDLNIDQAFKTLSFLYNGYSWRKSLLKSLPSRKLIQK